MSTITKKSDLDIYRVHAPAEAFTRVYHEILDDRNLSPDAKLLITHMLDQARKGEVYDIDRDTIAWWLGSGHPKGHAGRHRVDAAVKSAKDAGYILCEQENSPADGRFIMHWYVTEVRGHFNKAQMALPYEEQEDGEPPPERASPLSDFPTADTPAAEKTRSGKNPQRKNQATVPDKERARTRARDHGVMVNGDMVHGRERANEEHGRERPQGRRKPKANAVGGRCLGDLTDPEVLADTRRLLELFRTERARGSLEGVTTRQFVAAAVRSRRVVEREGGQVLRLFAGIVNRRGASPDSPGVHWVVIAEDDWAEANRLLEMHKNADDLAQKVCVVRAQAKQGGIDPYHLARKVWPQITHEEWQVLDRRYGLP